MRTTPRRCPRGHGVPNWPGCNGTPSTSSGASITIAQELDLPDADGTVAFGPTKTDTVRVINVGPDVIQLLRAHKRQQAALKLKNRPQYEDHNLVFCCEPEHLIGGIRRPKAPYRLGQPCTSMAEDRDASTC